MIPGVTPPYPVANAGQTYARPFQVLDTFTGEWRDASYPCQICGELHVFPGSCPRKHGNEEHGA